MLFLREVVVYLERRFADSCLNIGEKEKVEEK